MSATGLQVLDKSLQTTNIWLDDIMDEIGPDRRLAWKVLSVVLHKLRDRMPVGLAANFGAQLPLIIRGVYYDQYEPEHMPWKCRTMEEFVDEVAEWLSDARPVNPWDAVRAVFLTLSRHLPQGQIDKVRRALPGDMRDAWEMLEDEVFRGARAYQNA